MRENFAEDAIKAQAEQRMLAGKADPVEKFPQGTKSRDELGAMAGVSGKTYEHAVANTDVIQLSTRIGKTCNLLTGR